MRTWLRKPQMTKKENGLHCNIATVNMRFTSLNYPSLHLVASSLTDSVFLYNRNSKKLFIPTRRALIKAAPTLQSGPNKTALLKRVI